MNRFILKKLALMMSLLLIGSAFVGCNGTSEEGSNQQSQGNNANNGDVTTAGTVATTVDTRAEGENVEAVLNQEAENEDIGITLKDVYQIKQLEDDDYIFLAVYLEITNNSNVEQSYSNLIDFGIRIDGSDDILDSISPANTLVYIKANTDFNLLSGTVAPGTMLDGLVTAMVPKNFKEATLVFYPNYHTSKGEITYTFTPEDWADLPTNK